MNAYGALVVYVSIWWLVLFIVLPFRVKSQIEADEFVQGTDAGAPVKSYFKEKLLVTTGISFVLWCLFLLNFYYGWLTLDMIPGYKPKSFL
jgi:predicted secreted protein